MPNFRMWMRKNIWAILCTKISKKVDVNRVVKKVIWSSTFKWQNSTRRQRGHAIRSSRAQLCVPQGSVAGPLAFTLFSSPLPAIIESHNIQCVFFADDSQMYLHFKPEDCHQAVKRIEASLHCRIFARGATHVIQVGNCVERVRVLRLKFSSQRVIAPSGHSDAWFETRLVSIHAFYFLPLHGLIVSGLDFTDCFTSVLTYTSKISVWKFWRINFPKTFSEGQFFI